MVNSQNNTTFVQSTLKVRASENLNIENDLNQQNDNNKTISELLTEDEEKKDTKKDK